MRRRNICRGKTPELALSIFFSCPEKGTNQDFAKAFRVTGLGNSVKGRRTALGSQLADLAANMGKMQRLLQMTIDNFEFWDTRGIELRAES